MNPEASFNKFEELPPELQLLILENRPEILRRAPEFSSQIRQLVEPRLAREYCNQPITDQEYRRYLKGNPAVVGFISSQGPLSTFSLYYGLTRGLYLSLESNIHVDDPNGIEYHMQWSDNEYPAKDLFWFLKIVPIKKY